MLVAYIFATIASVYKVFVSPQLHFGDSWTLFSLTQEASCLHFCNNCKCIQSIRLTSTAFWGVSDPLFCKTSSTHLTCQLQNCKCTKYTRSTHPSGGASFHLLWSVGEAIEVNNPKGIGSLVLLPTVTSRTFEKLKELHHDIFSNVFFSTQNVLGWSFICTHFKQLQFPIPILLGEKVKGV